MNEKILFNRYYFIRYKNKNNKIFNGIVKTSYFKDINQFLFKIQIYEIKVDDKLILSIKNKINENQFNDSIFKKINTVLYNEFNLDSKNAEKYLDFLTKNIEFIYNKLENKSDDVVYIWNIFNKFKFPLVIKDIKYFKKDLQTFVDNYALIESLYKLQIEKTNNQLVNNQEIINKEKKEEISTNSNDNFNILDILHEYIDNEFIKISLINNIFNYYKYINIKEFEYFNIEDNIININIPNLFYDCINNNNDNLKNIILLSDENKYDQIVYYFKKIINLILDYNKEKQSFIELISCIYLLLIYSLYITHKLNPDFFNNKFYEVIISSNNQSKLINHYIKKIHNDNLRINILDYENFNNRINNEELSNLIDKYKYLKNINNDEFINNILKDKNKDDINHNININKQKILDISNIINSNNNSNLLLNYALNNKDVLETDLYKLLIQYLNNKYLVIENIQDYKTECIKKIFPILEVNLNHNTFDIKNINTLNYYNILLNIIPDSKNIDSNIILIIIFQIIIPYYYNTYNIHTFYDCLL